MALNLGDPTCERFSLAIDNANHFGEKGQNEAAP
jgi:hypothetical protein